MFEYIFLGSIILFTAIMSYQDILYRKIKNSLTYTFIVVSLFLFLYSQYINFNIYSWIILAMFTLISFYLFHKKILGAADGKITIGISLVTLSINSLYLFDFIINTIILYVLMVVLLILFRTSLKNKIKSIKQQDYHLIIFQTLFTLSVLALFSRFIGFNHFDILFTLSLFILILVIVSPIAKKIFKKVDENSQIVISFILFSYAFYDLFSLFLSSFIYLFCIKTLIQIIPDLSENIQYKRGHTTFPLVPILMLSLITVIIFEKNIILVFFGL